MSKPISLGKKRENIVNLSSAEFADSGVMVMVNMIRRKKSSLA